MRLDELLRASAARHPTNVALYDVAGSALDYQSLEARAESVAQRLREAGVGPSDRVGVLLPKTMDCVAVLFGILKVGAAYVPVDVDGPMARAAYIFTDCSVAGVVVATEQQAALHEALEHADPAWSSGEGHFEVLPGSMFEAPSATYSRARGPDGLAYILYTSGSTGVPKGVMHTHESAMSFVDWCSETFSPVPTDRFTSHAPFHFDLSILDLYVSLKHGAAIVLFRSEEGKQPGVLAQAIEERRISVWYSTPTILRMLVEYGGLDRVDHSSLRCVLFAGEVFPLKHLHALRRVVPQPTYYNLYGPTETNVCTAFRLDDVIDEAGLEATPIGTATSDDVLRVVDAEGRDVVAGEQGELWVRGGSVMVGYWNLPDNDARVFVQDGQHRWYRTGDLVRAREDGNLIYVGRRDRMIKRRGYRVELGEIEAALGRHDSIGEVAVVAGAGADSAVEIYAHFTWSADKPPSTIRLKKFCGQNLPLYMMPDRFIQQPELPKTSSDKLDYKRLEELRPWTSN